MTATITIGSKFTQSPERDPVTEATSITPVDGENTVVMRVPEGMGFPEACRGVLQATEYHISHEIPEGEQRIAWIECTEPNLAQYLADHFQMPAERMQRPPGWGQAAHSDPVPTSAAQPATGDAQEESAAPVAGDAVTHPPATPAPAADDDIVPLDMGGST